MKNTTHKEGGISENTSKQAGGVIVELPMLKANIVEARWSSGGSGPGGNVDQREERMFGVDK